MIFFDVVISLLGQHRQGRSDLLLLIIFLKECFGHVVITYPPARKYPLDFMDNKRTRGPCAMTRDPNNAHYTDLQTGSEIDVHFHVAYTHDGGIFVDILDENNNEVYRYPSISGFLFENDASVTHLKVKLPDTECDKCTLRIVKDAKDWGPNYLFWSCADINLIKSVPNSKKCSNHGTYDGKKCICNRLYAGDRCQFKDECKDSTDCSSHGECIDSKSTRYPRFQCYCKPGWFGSSCQKESRIKKWEDVKLRFYRKTTLDDSFLFYHRLLEDFDGDIEVVMRATSSTWLAAGWRPAGMSGYCRRFPTDSQTNEYFKEKPDAAPEPGPETSEEPAPATELTEEPTEPAGENNGGSGISFEGGDSIHPMDCTDIVVGTAKGDLSRIGDYYTRDRSSPLPDEEYGGENSLTAAFGFEKDGITTIVFRKPLDATHPTDWSIENEIMHVIWARGQQVNDTNHFPNSAYENDKLSDRDYYRPDELKYHGHGSHRGALNLRFADPVLTAVFTAQMKIQAEYVSEYRDQRSSSSKNMTTYLESQLSNLFTQKYGLVGLTVGIKGLSPGSIIVDFEVSMEVENSELYNISCIVNSAIRDIVKGNRLNQFNLDTNFVSISPPVIVSTSRVTTESPGVHGHDDDDDDDDDDIGKVEIIIISCAAALVFIAIIVLFYCWWKSNDVSKPKESNCIEEDHAAQQRVATLGMKHHEAHM